MELLVYLQCCLFAVASWAVSNSINLKFILLKIIKMSLNCSLFRQMIARFSCQIVGNFSVLHIAERITIITYFDVVQIKQHILMKFIAIFKFWCIYFSTQIELKYAYLRINDHGHLLNFLRAHQVYFLSKLRSFCV